MISSPETLLFKFLDYLPLSGVTGLVSLVVISLFFITSADSGIYVLNNIASRDKKPCSTSLAGCNVGYINVSRRDCFNAIGGLRNLRRQ